MRTHVRRISGFVTNLDSALYKKGIKGLAEVMLGGLCELSARC
jgi:hypothetical protein